MTRRGDRRRYAILGVLAENGPSGALELCRLLYRSPGTLYPDLAALEGEGRIVGEWHDIRAGYPRRRLYRLPTDEERRARRNRPSVLFFDPTLIKQEPPRRWLRPVIGGDHA